MALWLEIEVSVSKKVKEVLGRGSFLTSEDSVKSEGKGLEAKRESREVYIR